MNKYQSLKAKVIREYNWDNKANIKDNKQNKELVQRLVVNYMRHKMTDYDKLIPHVGYEKLNRIVYSKIEKLFPHLGKECRRQLNNKFTKIF